MRTLAAGGDARYVASGRAAAAAASSQTGRRCKRRLIRRGDSCWRVSPHREPEAAHALGRDAAGGRGGEAQLPRGGHGGRVSRVWRSAERLRHLVAELFLAHRETFPITEPAVPQPALSARSSRRAYHPAPHTKGFEGGGGGGLKGREGAAWRARDHLLLSCSGSIQQR